MKLVNLVSALVENPMGPQEINGEKYVCVPLLSSESAQTGIPWQIAHIISLAITIIQIIVPILLIVWGMLDLGKAVMAQKEDEIKKGQQTFVKRLVAAAIVFFVVLVVRLVINLVGGSDSSNIVSCINAIIDAK